MSAPGEWTDEEKRISIAEIKRQERIAERSAARAHAPYGDWCRDPDACRGKGYCPLSPTCGD